MPKRKPNKTYPTTTASVVKNFLKFILLVNFLEQIGALRNPIGSPNPYYGYLNFPNETYIPVDPEFPQIMGVNISAFYPAPVCVSNPMGFTTNKHICDITFNDTVRTFYLKPARPDQNIHLNEVSNYEIAKLIGVKIPDFGYMLKDSVLYIGAESYPNFTMAQHYYYNPQPHLSPSPTPDMQTNFTTVMKKLIGDTGISQLTVLKSLVNDMNVENWGADDKGNLVAVDVDKFMKSLNEYFSVAYRSIDLSLEPNPSYKNYKYISFDLSVYNILHIKNIYTALYHHGLPEVRLNIYNKIRTILDDNFATLLKGYIFACNNALNKINITDEHNASIASASYTTILATEIMQASQLNFTSLNITELIAATSIEKKLILSSAIVNKFQRSPVLPHSAEVKRILSAEGVFVIGSGLLVTGALLAIRRMGIFARKNIHESQVTDTPQVVIRP